MSALALLASNAILLGVVFVLGRYFHRRLRRVEQSEDHVTELYIEQLQHQISVLQRDLLKLAERLEQQARPSEVSATVSPYKQAIELISQGMGAADVAARCGISRSEAELILSLYRNNSTS
jgi:hypothetical protein